MTCRCPSCAAARGVSPAPTFTEAHRQACEVRWLGRMPLAARQDFLDAVAKRRGPAARDDLAAGLVGGGGA